MPEPSASRTQSKGGEFLLRKTTSGEIFTLEDFTEEQLAIARMVDEFWIHDIEPNLTAIRSLKPGAARSVLRKSAELGLAGVNIPEKYGGMELDLVSSLIVAQRVARDASYMMWEGGHCTIGTLPLVYFGTEDQKRKYLPKILSLDMLAAYALSEPEAGSDALAARTRADLNAAGSHYILNGQKMWITNGSEADLFTVFAKVGGEKFTAFLVERNFGVKAGAEEHKMGLKGSSTTALFFDNVPVPVENVLGEVGRGHIIAFNVLNIGRLKIGASTLGTALDLLQTSIKYAKERKAFGGPIANLGAIQHKLAEMAIRIYAVESMLWRTAGLIQEAGGVSWEDQNAAEIKLKAIAEFAAECSILKVTGSEMLGYVADEAVQIHGGYGFHEDYGVERAYRDARINRIFEGTNEINRLIIAGMLVKRSARGESKLIDAARAAWKQATENPEALSELTNVVARSKFLTLMMIGAAYGSHGDSLEKQQEIVTHLSDAITEVFAIESCLLRSEKLGAMGRGPVAQDMAAVLTVESQERIVSAARTVLAACAQGDRLDGALDALNNLGTERLTDTIALRRRIAERLIEKERYTV